MGLCLGESEVALLRRRSAVAVGLGGAAVAQGAKGAGRGNSRCEEDELAFVFKGEYVGVGARSKADCRLETAGAKMDSFSYVCRFSSVSFIWRMSSTTVANLGCSCVAAAAESRLRAPKFFRACGMVDQRFLLFFSGLGFSSRLSKESNGLRTGVAGVAESVDGDGSADAADLTGVGGPTSSSPKR
jgi:hypothetical protein